MYLIWVFLFASLCGGAGFVLFRVLFGSGAVGILGALAGLVFSALAEFSLRRLRLLPARVLLGALLGAAGAVTLFALALVSLPPELRSSPAAVAAQPFVGVVLLYFGLSLGARKGEEFSLEDFVGPFLKKPSDEADIKILDTSVIIDGRISDLCETGFIEGVLLVPQFVLRELQYIADSPDALKRNRGRRGLDVLQVMQKKADLKIVITDQDFPKVREVDGKLIALARKTRGKIITNDFNLNKVAELNGVQVLNINLLANALKPVVLPGELMKVHVLREGKESNQGVAYLDDGTMVVVDNGRRFIGRNVEVTVTSVLQTSAGRMIFSQLKEEVPSEAAVPGTVSGAAAGAAT